MVEPSYVASSITGILYGVLAWFPVALNGNFMTKFLSSVDPYLANHIVPAYMGMMLAVLFYFRNTIERALQIILRRQFEADFRFLFYASIFTLVIGYPTYTAMSMKLSPSYSDVLNAVIGVLILIISMLKIQKKGRIHRLESGMREKSDEPTLVDSIITGITQGLAFIDGLSRTGLTIIPLIITGINIRKVLELSFLLAPIYLLLRLIFIGKYTPVSPMDSFIVFTASFAASIVTMHFLLKLADKSGRKGVGVVFGFVAVIVCLMGVII